MVHSVPQRLLVISMFCAQLSKIFALDAIEPVCVQQGQCSRATLLASGISTTKVLTFVPQTLSPNITRLDITGNSILTFTGTELNVYSKLEEVVLTGNPAKVIPVSMFAGLPKLKNVYMDGLSNITLHRDTFVNNPSLRIVSCEQSGLLSLPSGLFRNNPNLVQVSFQGNSLTGSSIADDLFDYQLSNNLTLFLNKNPLIFLREGFFYGLARQTIGTIKIDVYQTQLKYLPLRLPGSVAFANAHTNPGFQPYGCMKANDKRFQYLTTPTDGVLVNYCTMDCSVCPEDQYVASPCSDLLDTVCAPLPASCLLEGNCAGRGLARIPLALSTTIPFLNMSNNRVFSVEARGVSRLSSTAVTPLSFVGNPGYNVPSSCFRSSQPNISASTDVAMNVCTASCYLNDAEYCGSSASWIKRNCSALLPPVCTACRSAPCSTQDQYTVANCSLYQDKLCANCTKCGPGRYVTANCTEYTDRQCEDCAVCGPQQFYARNCSLYGNAQCGSCSEACLGCFGPHDTSCKICADGYISVNGTVYGQPLSERKCVKYLPCPYTEWSEWSPCSVSCGGGVSYSNRSLLTVWPCSSPETTIMSRTCNLDECVFPELHVSVTLTNTTLSQVNATQLERLGWLISDFLKQPRDHITFNRFEYQELNTTVTTVTFNYSSGLNVNRTVNRPDLGVYFVLLFDNFTSFEAVTPDDIASLGQPVFAGMVSTLLGRPVTPVVNVTVPANQTSPSPSPVSKPPSKSIQVPIPAAVGGGGGAVALITAAILLWKCKRGPTGKHASQSKELSDVKDLSSNPLAVRSGSLAGLLVQSKRRLMSFTSMRKQSDANITPPLDVNSAPKAPAVSVDASTRIEIAVTPEMKPALSPQSRKLSPLNRLSVSQERRGSKDRRVKPVPTTIHVGSMDEADASEVGEMRPNTRERHGSVVSFIDVDASSDSPSPGARKKSSPVMMSHLEQMPPPRSVSPLRLEAPLKDPASLPRKSSMLIRKSSKSSVTPKRRLPTSALSRSMSKDPSAFS